MIDNRTVGKTISTLRLAKGMTQQQLAAAMNVSHQAVSKWENGAALPDIQTLVDLSRLFGITLEQLLNGDIPEARLENDKPKDDHIQNIGSFVGGVFNDIGSMFNSEPKTVPDAAQEDGAVDAEVVGDEDEKEPSEEQNIDLQQLLQMAPFMSKSAVGEMLKNSHLKLTAAEIAPFLECDYLEQLIRESEPEMSWDTLRKIAPFLKKEVVDALAKTVAMGEKYSRPTADEINLAVEDVAQAIDGVSKKITTGVRKVFRLGENVAAGVGKAVEDFNAKPISREERLAKLRSSAFERALEDGRWDWIEAHISEVQDDDHNR